MKTTPGMEDVAHLGFPELRPFDPTRNIDTTRCFETGIDPEWGIILICTRAQDHTGRHHTGNGEIITKVWG